MKEKRMKTTGKIGILARAGALLVLAGLLFGGCANPLEPGGDAPPSGKGYVRVSIGSGFVPRTILPNAEHLYYELTFTDGSATVTETLGGAAEKTVALSTGTWNLVVLGYASPMDAGAAGAEVVNGSAGPFTVSSGTNSPVEVALAAAQAGTGTLRYRLEYPSSPAVSGGKLYLEKIGGGFTQTVTLSLGSSSIIGRVPNLSSGYYQAGVYLYNGKLAVVSDLAHIYDNMDTELKLVLSAGDFAEVSNLSPLNAAIAAAKSAPEGIKISGDGTGIAAGVPYVSQGALDALNAAIAEAEKVIGFYGSGLAQSLVDGAVTALNAAVDTFNAAKGTGSVPATNTALYENTGGGDSLVSGAGTSIASALDWLKTNAVSNTAYTIVVGADESLGPTPLGGSGNIFDGKVNVSLTLRGDAAERIIQLDAPGSLFTINGGVTLILDQRVTLQGRADNTAPLLRINDGGLIMGGEIGFKVPVKFPVHGETIFVKGLLPGAKDPVYPDQGPGSLRQGSVVPQSRGPDHRQTQEFRVPLGGEQHRTAGNIGLKLVTKKTFRRPAGDPNLPHRGPAFLHHGDYVPDGKADSLAYGPGQFGPARGKA